MTLRVLVLGPKPKSAGGIGVLMGHLEATPSDTTNLSFVDAGATGKNKAARFLFALVSLAIKRHTYDFVHINLASKGSTVRKFFLTFILHAVSKPYLLHLHGGGYEKFYNGLKLGPKRLIRRMFCRAEMVLVLGSSWQDFVHLQLGVPLHRIKVLPNGVPGPASIDYNLKKDNIIFAGRLSEAKGVPELLEAAGMIDATNPWSITLAGDCTDSRILAELQCTNLPITWSGWVGSDEIERLMSKARAFVLPSHTEGLPLALLDAMAHGALPIVTPVGSIPEVVQHGFNGLMIPVSDPANLAKAIQFVFSEPELSEELCRNARMTWEHHYSVQKLRAELDVIYRELVRTAGEYVD